MDSVFIASENRTNRVRACSQIRCEKEMLRISMTLISERIEFIFNEVEKNLNCIGLRNQGQSVEWRCEFV